MICSNCTVAIEGYPKLTIAILEHDTDGIGGGESEWGFYCSYPCALADVTLALNEDTTPPQLVEQQSNPEAGDAVLQAAEPAPQDAPPPNTYGAVGNFYGGGSPEPESGDVVIEVDGPATPSKVDPNAPTTEADPALENLLASEEAIQKLTKHPENLPSQELANELLNNVICKLDSGWAWGVIETATVVGDMLFHAVLQHSDFEEDCSIYCDEKSIAFVFENSDTFNLNLAVDGFSILKDGPAIANYFKTVAYALDSKYNSEAKSDSAF